MLLECGVYWCGGQFYFVEIGLTDANAAIVAAGTVFFRSGGGAIRTKFPAGGCLDVL